MRLKLLEEKFAKNEKLEEEKEHLKIQKLLYFSTPRAAPRNSIVYFFDFLGQKVLDFLTAFMYNRFSN